MRNDHIAEAIRVVEALGVPRAQHNKRSALCLLALLDLRKERKWKEAKAPLLGITPMMEWMREHYGKNYAPNTRETIRRQTMHQFCDAGLVRYNPDNPERAVNSPKAVYQIAPEALTLLRDFETSNWASSLSLWLKTRETLVKRYAKERVRKQIPVQFGIEQQVILSPGKHSELIRSIIEEFTPRFSPDGLLVYAGDTEKKWGYFNSNLLEDVGVYIEPHGKMPDVIIYDEKRNWLLLVEAVTSHGPVDGKRYAELAKLFSASSAGLVYVTAFPSRSIMSRYLGGIAWETEVWVADAPSHLIHFNGSRFLGPYSDF